MASRTRLRQIALVAENLDQAKRLLTHVLGSEVIYVDPVVEQWGLKNILVAVGGDVIEVVSPFKDGTTAGRLLAKRGDGGYMVIMQTDDAAAARDRITSRKLARVVFGHESDGSVMAQYHPKGIKGGVMPELDSQAPTPEHADPLLSRFSPWQPCGNDYASYSDGFKRCAHLQLAGAVLRLAAGDSDVGGAAKQWETLFGVPRNGDALVFTNATMRFAPGEEGASEGLDSITIAVTGEDQLQGILRRARDMGLSRGDWVEMLGVRWYFTRSGSDDAIESKL